MGKFLDELERFEEQYCLAAIRIYLINHKTGSCIPNYVKFTLDDWQEDLSEIIRHYVNFDNIILPEKAI